MRAAQCTHAHTHARTHPGYKGTSIRTSHPGPGDKGASFPFFRSYDIPHLTNSAHALIPRSLYIYKLPVTTMALANLKFATPPSNSLFRLNPSTIYTYNPP